jgi:hypothetical protein
MFPWVGARADQRAPQEQGMGKAAMHAAQQGECTRAVVPRLARAQGEREELALRRRWGCVVGGRKAKANPREPEAQQMGKVSMQVVRRADCTRAAAPRWSRAEGDHEELG